MTAKDRLENAFLGGAYDRTPILGGWLACPDYIREIAGVDTETYWENPRAVSAEAYRRLGMDGLIDLYVPVSRDDYRIVDANSSRKANIGLSLEDCLEWIEASPDGAELESAFDFEGEYERFRAGLEEGAALCGEMLYMPAQWGAGSRLQWYDDFGYENFFLIMGGYPEHAKKMLGIGGAQGYLRCRLVARAVEEGRYPHAILLGEDICSQRGPMVSPEFLAEHYAPLLERGLSPLLEVGCRPVWHSDGDIRPLVDMLNFHTRGGDPLIIFSPMAVTTELPVLTPGEVRRKVREAVALCADRARLVLFTSNTINPDIPLENIYAMYEAVRN